MGKLEETQQNLLGTQKLLEKAQDRIVELVEKDKGSFEKINKLQHDLITERELAETEQKIAKSTIR